MIIRSAIIIVAVTMVGRLLGFLKGVFISEEFGIGMETDAYFMAFVIPMTLLMIIPGAINSVFIPAMNGLMIEGEGRSRERGLFQSTLTVIFISTLIVTVVGILAAEPLVSLLAPGFEGEKQALTVQLLRWMMPSVVLIGLLGLFSSALYCHNSYFYPSFGTVINSLLVIASIFILVPFMGIQGLALGTTLGFAGYALIMVPSLVRRRYPLRLAMVKEHNQLMRGMGERFVPVMIGGIVSQLTIYAERFLASGLGDAKVASLSLAYTVMQLPMAVFVGAFTVPLFPLLTEYVKKGQIAEMKRLVEKGLSYLVLVLVPVMGGLVLLSKDVVRLLYERGQFGADDTVLTAWALMFYSLAILGLAARDVLTRAFYALENMKIPVIIGIVSIALYLGISPLLIARLDHGGIALAAAVSAYFSWLCLGWLLRRQVGAILTRSFYLSFLRSLLAALVMLLVIWWAGGVPGQGEGLLADFTLGVKVPLLIFFGMVVYFLSLLLLREKLAFELAGKVANKYKQLRGRR